MMKLQKCSQRKDNCLLKVFQRKNIEKRLIICIIFVKILENGSADRNGIFSPGKWMNPGMCPDKGELFGETVQNAGKEMGLR